MGELSQQIQFAAFLIALGKATYEEVRDLFAKQGHDDEKLAAIMAEVDQRIARRA